MRFSKIKIGSKGVQLIRTTKNEQGATETFDLESPEGPLKSFADAMQKFRDYVVGLLPFFFGDGKGGDVDMNVTTINLSETKDGRRGLMVSVTVPIEALNGKAVSITTPIVQEEPEENKSEDMRYLSDDEMQLIGLLEGEATKYYNGEREQADMFANETKSENEKEFDSAAASAEVKSTRKPRQSKAKPEGASTPAFVQ